jgi:hypothetical protein
MPIITRDCFIIVLLVAGNSIKTRIAYNPGGWIILGWILGRWYGVMWTGLVKLKIGTGGELL